MVGCVSWRAGLEFLEVRPGVGGYGQAEETQKRADQEEAHNPGTIALQKEGMTE